MLYAAPLGVGEPSRIGFIVSKAVGNAVTRNLVKEETKGSGCPFPVSARNGPGGGREGTASSSISRLGAASLRLQRRIGSDDEAFRRIGSA